MALLCHCCHMQYNVKVWWNTIKKWQSYSQRYFLWRTDERTDKAIPMYRLSFERTTQKRTSPRARNVINPHLYCFCIYCVSVTRFNNYHQFLILKRYHILRCFTYIRKIAFFDSTQEVLFKPTRLYISNWRWTYNYRYSSQNNFLHKYFCFHFISYEVTHNCLFVCESISDYW